MADGGHVILCGCGRVGRPVSLVLEAAKVPTLRSSPIRYAFAGQRKDISEVEIERQRTEQRPRKTWASGRRKSTDV